MPNPTEAGFEQAICDSLIDAGGYLSPVKTGMAQGAKPGTDGDLDASVGIDTAELFAFIGATQNDEWEKVRESHGSPEEAQRAF